jgi:autotransporter-associated beta strand protein
VSGRIENGEGIVSLIKAGAGSWTLSAANTYSGMTTVSQGPLIVNGATGTGLTTVESGATLGGNGNIAGGLSALGVVAPGNSAGTLTVTGSAILAAGSTLVVEIGGGTPGSQYDRFIVTGQLSIGGNMAVALTNGFVPGIGASFDLIDWGSRSGLFTIVALPTMTNRGWDTSRLYSDGILSVVSTLPGDFNGDARVDAADYVVWRKTGGTELQYNTWRTNFGQTVGSGSLVGSPVPEPGLCTIVCYAILTIATGRRRPLVNRD